MLLRISHAPSPLVNSKVPRLDVKETHKAVTLAPDIGSKHIYKEISFCILPK